MVSHGLEQFVYFIFYMLSSILLHIMSLIWGRLLINLLFYYIKLTYTARIFTPNFTIIAWNCVLTFLLVIFFVFNFV